jgi:prolyl oligopeptidase
MDISRSSLTSKFVAFLLLLVFAVSTLGQTAPPKAEVRNVTDEYFGTKIVDPYRWMEDLKSDQMQKWMKGQAEYADNYLKGLPMREAFLERIKTLDSGAPFWIGYFTRRPNGTLYYLKQNAADNVAKLYVRDKNGKETLLVDPERRVSSDGKHYTLEFYRPSPDGKYVAYALAQGGSEKQTIYILDTATGRDLSESLNRIERQYNVPTWLPDGSGFFYAQRQQLAPNALPTEIYKNTRAYLHKLGDDQEKDLYVFGIGTSAVKLESTDFPSVISYKDSPFVIGQVSNGDSQLRALYSAPVETISKPNVPWKKICDFSDAVTDFAVSGADIYLTTSKNAPRFKVVRTSLANPDFAKATIVMPASEKIIDGVSISKDAVYIDVLEDGRNAVYRIDQASNGLPEKLKFPDGASGYTISANQQFEEVWLMTASWTKASAILSYIPKTKRFADTGLQPKGKFDDVPGYESIEVKVKSHDGVLVPLSILHKKGIKLDGTNPTVLYGYGSYGSVQYVGFNPGELAWLERGGVMATAHVRGGGEYGEDWHQAGYKTTKPNTWKDFIACAEYLIAKKYTSPAHLAGQGASAGGILIGRAITDRPDLFAAAIIGVGLNDMLRFETTTNGVPNIQEFGSTKTEEGFRALYAMSALHHVKDGVKYPAVLLTTGINDPRVEPWMSAKMAARLQAATASGKPVLLRVDYDAGHGIGSSRKQQNEGYADRLAFLFHQLAATNR